MASCALTARVSRIGYALSRENSDVGRQSWKCVRMMCAHVVEENFVTRLSRDGYYGCVRQ